MTDTSNWKIEPADGQIRLRRTEAGRFALPMVAAFDGHPKSHIAPVFTGAQIEELYRQMRALIAQGPVPVEDRAAIKADMGQW